MLRCAWCAPLPACRSRRRGTGPNATGPTACPTLVAMMGPSKQDGGRSGCAHKIRGRSRPNNKVSRHGIAALPQHENNQEQNQGGDPPRKGIGRRGTQKEMAVSFEGYLLHFGTPSRHTKNETVRTKMVNRSVARSASISRETLHQQDAIQALTSVCVPYSRRSPQHRRWRRIDELFVRDSTRTSGA